MLPVLTETDLSVPLSLPVFTCHGQGSALALHLLSTGRSNTAAWLQRKNSMWTTHLSVSTGSSAEVSADYSDYHITKEEEEEEKSPVFSDGQKSKGQKGS